MGLSDSAQAWLMLVALLLLGLGAVVAAVPTGIPSPQNDYIALILIVSGSAGAALKEWLGTQQSKPAKTGP